MRVPFQYQRGEYHCGPTSLWMLLKAYGIKNNLSQEQLGILCKTNRGTWIRDMNTYIKSLGLKFNRVGIKEAKKDLLKEKPIMISVVSSPTERHLVVGIRLKKYREDHILYTNDPYFGKDWKYPFDMIRALEPQFWRLEER